MRYRFLLEIFLLAIFYIYLSFLTATISFAGFVNSCSPQDCPIPPNSCSSYEKTLDDGKKYNVYECIQPPPTPVPQTCEERCATISDASQQAECFRQCRSTPPPAQLPPISGNATCNPDDPIGTCPSRGPCQTPECIIFTNGNFCVYSNSPEGTSCLSNAGTFLTCTDGTCQGTPPAVESPRTPTAAPGGVRPPGSSNPPPAGQPPAGGVEPSAQEAKCESNLGNAETTQDTIKVSVGWDLDGDGCSAKIVDYTEVGEIPLGEACKDTPTIDVSHLEGHEITLLTSSSACGADNTPNNVQSITITRSSTPPSSGTPPGNDVGACRTLKPSETRDRTDGQWPDSQWEWNAFCTNESACSSNADCTARNHKNPDGQGWCYGGFGGSSNDWRCIQLKQKNSTGTTPGAGQPAAATPTTPPGQPAATSTPTPTPLPPIENLDSSTFEAACQGTALTFRWRPVIGARKYAIRIDDKSNVWTGNNPPSPGDTMDDSVPGPNYTKANATSGRSYAWWVHSVDNADRWSNPPVHGPAVTCGSSAPTATPTVTPTGAGTPTTVPPTATPTPTPSGPTPTPIIINEVNIDRYDLEKERGRRCLNIDDLNEIIKVMAQIAQGQQVNQQVSPANLNGDNSVDILDIRAMINIMANTANTRWLCTQ